MLLIIGLRILSLVQLPYYLLVPSEIVKRIQKVACVSFMLFLGPTPRGGLLFFHVTAACSFLSISPVAVVDMYVAYPRFCSSRVGGVGCSNVLITLRLLAKRVHVTCCRCWHVALSLMLMLNRGGGGGVNNVPDGFKTVGHKGPCNLLPLLPKLGQLFKTKNGGWRNTKQAAGPKKLWELWRQMLIRCKVCFFECWPDRGDTNNYC